MTSGVFSLGVLSLEVPLQSCGTISLVLVEGLGWRQRMHALKSLQNVSLNARKLQVCARLALAKSRLKASPVTAVSLAAPARKLFSLQFGPSEAGRISFTNERRCYSPSWSAQYEAQMIEGFRPCCHFGEPWLLCLGGRHCC